MGPADAIRTCFVKSLQLNGRASRSEFWWFAPTHTIIVIVLVWFLLPNLVQITWYAQWLVTFFALLPMWACGARRLQDTGENGSDVFIPSGIFFGFPIAAVALIALGAAFHSIAALVLLFLVALPLAGFGLLVAFTSLGPTIGQLIVPSEPGENAYGPNPNEVPS